MLDGFCSFLSRSPASFRSGRNIRRFRRKTRVCSMSARGLQFNDNPPARLLPDRPEYYIMVSKTGKRPNQYLLFVAVTIVGPNLYVRNGHVPLLFELHKTDESSIEFQPLSFPIHLATTARHASVSIKDSIHFQADPKLKIFDGLPQNL